MKGYYLSGPMSGIAQFNFPAFIAATEYLRGWGLKIISPVELDGPQLGAAAMASHDGKHTPEMNSTATWGQLIARDVGIITDDKLCRGMIFLPRWHRSRGARLEAMAALQCPGRVFYEYRPDAFEGQRVTALTPVDVLDRLQLAQWNALQDMGRKMPARINA